MTTELNGLGGLTNRSLKLFLIFLAWPVIELGVSITFYLFILMVLLNWNSPSLNPFSQSKTSFRFYLFFFIALLSLIFAPEFSRKPGLGPDLKSLLQYGFWMTIAVFFSKFMPYYSFKSLSRYVFIGLFILTIHFFFFNIYTGLPVISTYISRNGFVYTILALWPIASYYIFLKYGKRALFISMVVTVMIMLVSEGRAGFIIILIENILIYSVFFRKLGRGLIVVVILSSPIAIAAINSPEADDVRLSVAAILSPYSPRISEFIGGYGSSGDLDKDKSWLTRELMVEKAKEIIELYPVFGVGISHFTSYDATFSAVSSVKYARLYGGVYSDDYYNTRSSHNSYVLVLGEMGIIGFISLLIILLPLVFHLVVVFAKNDLTFKHLPLIAIIGMLIHFYAITSLPGTLTWFVIGLAYASKYKRIKI